MFNRVVYLKTDNTSVIYRLCLQLLSLPVNPQNEEKAGEQFWHLLS